MSPRPLRTAQAFALVLAVPLLLLGGAMAWVHACLDARAQVAAAAAWLQDHQQRTLRVDGEVALEVLPSPGLRLSDVTLTDRQTDTEFAHVGQMRIGLDLWTLLRGQVRIDAVEASGLRLNLHRQADGQRNVDDLLDASALRRSGLKLPQVTLEDVRVRLNDAVNGVRGEAGVRRLALARTRAGRPAPAAFDMDLTLHRHGRALLSGRAQGHAGLSLDTARSLLALSDLSLDFHGMAGGWPEVSSRLVSQRVRHDLRTAVTDVDRLRLEARGVFPWLHLESSTWQARTLRLEPDAARLRGEGMTLTVRGHGPWQPLTAELGWTWLALQGADLSAGEGQAMLRWAPAGRAPLTVHLAHAAQAGAPLGTLRQVRLAGVALQLDGGKAGPGGTGRADLLLDLERGAAALDAAELHLQLPRGDAPPLPVTLTGALHAGPRSLHWGLDASLAGHAVSLEGDALFAGTVPELQLRTRIDTLDLDALAPVFAAAVPVDHPERPAGAGRLDLSVLRQVRGSLDVQARQLVWRGELLRDATVQAWLDGGMLRVPVIEVQLWGGQVSAEAFADARARRITLQLQGTGVRLEEPSAWLLGSPLVAGRGRLSVDVETIGETFDELAARWEGHAAFRLSGGRLLGLRPAGETSDEVAELHAGFEVRDGMAYSETVQGRALDGRRLTGTLTIDLVQRRAEGRLQHPDDLPYEWRAGVPGSAPGSAPGPRLTERLKGWLP